MPESGPERVLLWDSSAFAPGHPPSIASESPMAPLGRGTRSQQRALLSLSGKAHAPIRTLMAAQFVFWYVNHSYFGTAAIRYLVISTVDLAYTLVGECPRVIKEWKRVPKRCRRCAVGGGAQEPIETPRHFETLFLWMRSWVGLLRRVCLSACG